MIAIKIRRFIIKSEFFADRFAQCGGARSGCAKNIDHLLHSFAPFYFSISYYRLAVKEKSTQKGAFFIWNLFGIFLFGFTMTAWAVLGVVLDVGIFDLDLVFLVGKMTAIGMVVNIAVFIEDVIDDRLAFIARAFFTAKKAECK